MLAGLLALLVLGYAGVQRLRPAQSATANVQTSTVQRGSLQATVNTAGNIAASRTWTLNFEAAGTISKVKTVDVQVGDHVKAGDVLAELDTTELEYAVANAQSALAVGQAKLEQTKAGPTAEALAASQASVKSAETNLAKVKAGAIASEIAAAQAQVKAAQEAYDTLVKQPDAETVQQAKLKLDQSKNSLWAAQSARDASNGRGSTSPESKAQNNASVANAEIAVQLAQQAYEDAQKPATTQELQTALATLKNAQSNLANLKPTAAGIAAAQSQLEQTKSSLATLTQGPTDQELTIAQASVDQAEIALKQAQTSLDAAKLIAPFDATVTSVSIVAGQKAGSSSSSGTVGGAVGLADMTSLEVSGQLSEVDVARVQIGQLAQITIDALTGVTLQGRVAEIAPAGTVSQGVVNFPATVVLINPDAAVKPGMTANVNIVVDERQDVLMVPNRAIKTQGKQKNVTVMFEGQRIQTPVQTGLSNESYTEVTSGVKEGDEVIINTTTTSSTGGGMGGAMPGGVMGGPPP